MWEWWARDNDEPIWEVLWIHFVVEESRSQMKGDIHAKRTVGGVKGIGYKPELSIGYGLLHLNAFGICRFNILLECSPAALTMEKFIIAWAISSTYHIPSLIVVQLDEYEDGITLASDELELCFNRPQHSLLLTISNELSTLSFLFLCNA